MSMLVKLFLVLIVLFGAACYYTSSHTVSKGMHNELRIGQAQHIKSSLD
jgi:hypothetical protein